MALLEGYGIGLAMVIFIGPVFFLLLNSTLQHGSSAGLAVAFGIIFSDIVCVWLCYFGLSKFITATTNQFWIGVLGGLILLGLGIAYSIKKVRSLEETLGDTTLNSKKTSSFFIKGFSVNFFNPFVFVVWIGVFRYGSASYTNSISLLTFLIAVLLGILTTDVLKVLVAKRIRSHISAKKLGYSYKITGIILILFSVRLLYLCLQT